MPEQTCDWCGGPVPETPHGGSPRRFCRRLHRFAFHNAAKQAKKVASRRERIEYLSTDHPYDHRECIHCGEQVHKDYRFEGHAWDWYFNEKGTGACFGRDNDYNGNHEVSA